MRRSLLPVCRAQTQGEPAYSKSFHAEMPSGRVPWWHWGVTSGNKVESTQENTSESPHLKGMKLSTPGAKNRRVRNTKDLLLKFSLWHLGLRACTVQNMEKELYSPGKEHLIIFLSFIYSHLYCYMSLGNPAHVIQHMPTWIVKEKNTGHQNVMDRSQTHRLTRSSSLPI